MKKNRIVKAVILAAGNSTRMKSSKSKILHKILGKEIINYTVDAVINAGIAANNIIIVAGDNLNELKKIINSNVNYVIQEEKLGTAHAFLTADEYLNNIICDTLVLVGDNPYITTEEISRLIDFHRKNNAEASLITAVFPETPPPYGRIIRNKDNTIEAIVEELDADEEQKKIKEVNASIYIFKNEIVFDLIKKIDNNNKKGEYYLTDIIGVLKSEKRSVFGLQAIDYRLSIGINNRWDLQNAQKHFNMKRIKDISLNNGVTFLDPSTTTVEESVKIGKDTVIYPSTYISSGSTIGENCKIGPFAYIKNSKIPSNSTVEYQKVDNKQ